MFSVSWIDYDENSFIGVFKSIEIGLKLIRDRFISLGYREIYDDSRAKNTFRLYINEENARETYYKIDGEYMYGYINFIKCEMNSLESNEWRELIERNSS